jgi:polyhydroxyalkanoate synthesis repressor PhaR
MATQRRAAASAAAKPAASAHRVLKKYPNRRLYDTQSSSYITLTDVKRMVMQAEPFEVRDAKTGEDLTRSILLQIILEEETEGVPIFSTQMLAQLIRFYGHAMQGMMGAYLEKNLQTFVELQTRFAQPAKGLYDPSAFTPETWTAWLQGQSPPMMQNLMGQYLEQSGSLFAQMQEQLQRNSAGLFAGMPGFPGKPPAEP